jgi:DNA-binding response OmpR family regulator
LSLLFGIFDFTKCSFNASDTMQTPPHSNKAEGLAGKSILVIDDNEIMLKMICDLLHRSGFNVLSASDGVQGLKAYYAGLPCLVITDLIMPNKEGLEVIIELKKQDPKPKIIAISGGGRLKPQTYLPMAEMLGADHVLEKPFHPAELIALVRELLV